MLTHYRQNEKIPPLEKKLNLKIFTMTMTMLVTQSCLTLCDPMDYSPQGSSVHGILQARILEWVAFPFSRGSSPPRDRTWVSGIAGRFFADMREALYIFGCATGMWDLSSMTRDWTQAPCIGSTEC